MYAKHSMLTVFIANFKHKGGCELGVNLKIMEVCRRVDKVRKSVSYHQIRWQRCIKHFKNKLSLRKKMITKNFDGEVS